MTQNEKVLDYLENHSEGMTWLDAYTIFGIAALHSRISDLRREGYQIKSTHETVLNRDGAKCRVCRYTLCN